MISIQIENDGVHLTVKNVELTDIAAGAVIAVEAIAVSIERRACGRITSSEAMQEIGRAIIRRAGTDRDTTVIDLKALGKELTQ